MEPRLVARTKRSDATSKLVETGNWGSNTAARSMSTRPIVNDALWRCICPAYRPVSLQSVLASPRTKCIPSNSLRNSGYRSSSATSIPHSSSSGDFFPPTLQPNAAQYSGQVPHRHARPAPLGHFKKKEETPLVLFSTAELYERLRAEAAKGNHEEVMNIVRILIKDRRERPNTRLYAGILHSFSSPMAGTAGKIRKVLEEMAEVGMDLDAGVCHCVLEVRHGFQTPCEGYMGWLTVEIGPGSPPRLPPPRRNPDSHA